MSHKLKMFIMSSILSGTVFILSIAIVIAIYKWLWNHVNNFISPVTSFINEFIYAPDIVINVIAIIIVVAIAFVSGIILKSITKTYFESFVNKILLKIPFYGLIKESLEQIFTPNGAKSFDRKCIAKIYSDSAYSLGYITDEIPEKNLFVVYSPTAPVVSSGMIFFVDKDNVIEIDVDNAKMFRAIVSCGIGSSELIKDIEIKSQEKDAKKLDK